VAFRPVLLADEAQAAKQVSILDFRNERDFVLELTTRSKSDELILVKVPPEATLDKTVSAVERRVARGNRMPLSQETSLWIPVIDFEILREYSELYGKPITSHSTQVSGKAIVRAKQNISFKMDESGAVFKSEAIYVLDGGPHLDFDSPFLIVLRLANSDRPYFALWINNAELLVRFQPDKRRGH
jgi:hypothetical protein